MGNDKYKKVRVKRDGTPDKRYLWDGIRTKRQKRADKRKRKGGKWLPFF